MAGWNVSRACEKMLYKRLRADQYSFARPALPTAGGPQSGEGVADDQAVKTEPGSGTGVNGNEDEDGEGEDDDEQDDDQEEDDEDEDGNETGASDSESDY